MCARYPLYTLSFIVIYVIHGIIYTILYMQIYDIYSNTVIKIQIRQVLKKGCIALGRGGKAEGRLKARL